MTGNPWDPYTDVSAQDATGARIPREKSKSAIHMPPGNSLVFQGPRAESRTMLEGNRNAASNPSNGASGGMGVASWQELIER